MPAFEMVKVTSKGQMTLPIRVRKTLGINEGEYPAVYVDGEDSVLRRFPSFRKAGPQDAIFELLGQGEGPADLAEKHNQYLGEINTNESLYPRL